MSETETEKSGGTESSGTESSGSESGTTEESSGSESSGSGSGSSSSEDSDADLPAGDAASEIERLKASIDFERLEVDPPKTHQEATEILNSKRNVVSGDELRALLVLATLLPQD